MAQILIIDDDESMCYMLSQMIEKIGHKYKIANTLGEGLSLAQSYDFDLVLLDVRLPDGNGLAALPTFRKTSSEPEVIIITGMGDPDGAEIAIKSGAWDYIEKASSIQAMSLPLLRALQFREQKQTSQSRIVLKHEGIIGHSPVILSCFDLVAQAAASDVNVLIAGETGTGKELFANAIHENSKRSGKDFVVVDCASLPESLVESTLFGHAKGAFTGADRSKEGLVKMADGGTLFLDEIGELSLSVQKKFLRVLQERKFLPVGSAKVVSSNFRLVAATNKNLEKLSEDKQFRKDLLFRLRTITIELPPLRERGEGDIKELSKYFVKQLCDRYSIAEKEFSADLLETLTSYHWPGNVRELRNVIENVLATAQNSSKLFPLHLPPYIRTEIMRSKLNKREEPVDKSFLGDSVDTLSSFKDHRDEATAKIEYDYLQKLMSLCGWGINKACKVSKLSRPRLYALLKKHNITRP